jgi:primosomal replication protein N
MAVRCSGCHRRTTPAGDRLLRMVLSAQQRRPEATIVQRVKKDRRKVCLVQDTRRKLQLEGLVAVVQQQVKLSPSGIQPKRPGVLGQAGREVGRQHLDDPEPVSE